MIMGQLANAGFPDKLALSWTMFHHLCCCCCRCYYRGLCFWHKTA